LRFQPAKFQIDAIKTGATGLIRTSAWLDDRHPALFPGGVSMRNLVDKAYGMNLVTPM
jgi:hypothetical protein